MAKIETGTEPKFTTADPSKSDTGLSDLFKDGIMDIFWAENHLVKTLPKMIAAATSPDLKKTIEDHLQETKTHVSRLEEIFSLLDEKVIAKKCDAMEGLTKEGEGIIESTEAGTNARDVGVIMASQKVEHYEIATYGGLASLATTLGLNDVAALLKQTLTEEKAADEKLTEVTGSVYNQSIIMAINKKSVKPAVEPVNLKSEQLGQFRDDATGHLMTTNTGTKINDDQNSLKAGDRGPSLLEDFILREKITHFDHERIPERVVHARGSGAHGIFKLYEDQSAITKALFFE